MEEIRVERENESLRDELTGALIGLANATVGNEDLIEAQTMDLVLRGLAATLDGSCTNDETLKMLLESVRSEKARIVPNCASCKNPCGRNADYDMEFLRTDREEIRSGKFRILSGIREMAAEFCRSDKTGIRAEKMETFMLKALRTVGDDWMAEVLPPMIAEVDQMRKMGKVCANLSEA